MRYGMSRAGGWIIEFRLCKGVCDCGKPGGRVGHRGLDCFARPRKDRGGAGNQPTPRLRRDEAGTGLLRPADGTRKDRQGTQRQMGTGGNSRVAKTEGMGRHHKRVACNEIYSKNRIVCTRRSRASICFRVKGMGLCMSGSRVIY
jgi:hypothetical protein